MRTGLSVTRIIRGLLWVVAGCGVMAFLYTFWPQPVLVSASGDWVLAETPLEIWTLRCLYISFIAFALYREVCRLSPNPRLSYNPLTMFLIFCLLIGSAYGVLLYNP